MSRYSDQQAVGFDEPNGREKRTQVVRDIHAILKQNAWIFVGLIVLGIAGGWGVTKLLPTKYTATASVFVASSPGQSSSDAFQGTQFAQQRMASYAQLVKGDVLTQQVIDNLQLNTTTEKLADNLNVTVVPDTVVMNVSATDKDAHQAKRIADETVKVLSKQVDQLDRTDVNAQPVTRLSAINSAQVPEKPSSPNIKLGLVFGALVGLLIAMVVAALRFYLDRSVRSASELERRTNLPRLGSVPVLKDKEKAGLLDFFDENVRAAEAFRELRMNLRYANVDQRPRVISITSSVSGEGKSLTALNLAAALAADGDTVCLVDADMRRSKVAQYLNGAVHSSVGLSTVLAGEAELLDTVQPSPVELLDVLTSGATPPNPSELLSSHSFNRILSELQDNYDWVIVDTPPILPVTDGALVSTAVDAVLLVVRYGERTYDDVNRTLASLHTVRAPLIGLVLTAVPQRSDEGKYVGAYTKYHRDDRGNATGNGSAPIQRALAARSEVDAAHQGYVEEEPGILLAGPSEQGSDNEFAGSGDDSQAPELPDEGPGRWGRHRLP